MACCSHADAPTKTKSGRDAFPPRPPFLAACVLRDPARIGPQMVAYFSITGVFLPGIGVLLFVNPLTRNAQTPRRSEILRGVVARKSVCRGLPVLREESRSRSRE